MNWTLEHCPACQGTGETPTGPIGKNERCHTCWGVRKISMLRDGNYFIKRDTVACGDEVYGLRRFKEPRQTIHQERDLQAMLDYLGDQIATDYRLWQQQQDYTARTGKPVFSPVDDPRG